jgi:hypothetical protein
LVRGSVEPLRRSYDAAKTFRSRPSKRPPAARGL